MSGYINVLNPADNQPKTFNAHGDNHPQGTPADPMISLLVARASGDAFFSLSKSGLLRLWVLDLAPNQQAPP